MPGARTVLEPMCGNARYGRAFVERGLTYTGIDLSAQMLAQATVRPGMHLHEADARDFAFPGQRFDIVWCPINSIRHLLDDADLLAHLGRIREHLADDGLYVVEIDMVEHDGPWPDGPDDKSVWELELPDGSVIKALWCLDRGDAAARRLWERASVKRLVNGTMTQEVEHVYEMRMLGVDDWPDLVARAGFEITAVHHHESSTSRPRVELGPALENTGQNYYFVLRPGH